MSSSRVPLSLCLHRLPVVLLMAGIIILPLLAGAEAPPPDPLNWCGTQKHWEADLAARGETVQQAMSACGTRGQCDVPETRDGWIPDGGTPWTHVRLVVHILAENDGSNPMGNEATVENAVAHLNAHYAPSRIHFDHMYNQVNSTTWRYLDENEIDGMKLATAIQPDRWLNVWVTTVYFGYSFGTFPFGSDALEPTGGIVLGHFHWGGEFSTFAHEAGHNLGLWHTFHGVAEVSQCTGCYEAVDSPDRNIVGDYCADTPPQYLWRQCNDAPGIDSCSGLPWGATQPENYMSYSPDACQSLFTAQQQGRMQCWIDDALSGWISGVLIQSNTRFGAAPLAVDFSGLSYRDVTGWNWTFGDGDGSTDPAPSHTFTAPGLYTVTADIETTEGPYTDEQVEYVWVHADTVDVVSAGIAPDQPIALDLSLTNYLPLQQIQLPVIWSAENGLALDSISAAGTRTDYFETVELTDLDNGLRRATVFLKATEGEDEVTLAPGTGPVVTLYFTSASGLNDITTVEVTDYDNNWPVLYSPIGFYGVQTNAGTIFSSTCCQETVGDVNGLAGNEPTIGDISTLLDFLFINEDFSVINCIHEADVNQSGGANPTPDDLTIGDVSALVDYLFIIGPDEGELLPCL